MPNIFNLKNQPVVPPGKSTTTAAIQFQKWFQPARLSKELTRSGFLCQYDKVRDFASTYEIDPRMVEGCESLNSEDECWKRFSTVNDFFIRRRVGVPKGFDLKFLKEQYRVATAQSAARPGRTAQSAAQRVPRDLEKRVIVSPADNYCVYLPEFAIRDKLWIKGEHFSVRKLFQTPVPTHYQILVFRLAPHHYHRFHCPLSGKVLSMRYTGSEYFSVAPRIVNSKIDVLTRNVRLNLTLESSFDKEDVYMSIVGASCVGSIQITHPKLLQRLRAKPAGEQSTVRAKPAGEQSTVRAKPAGPQFASTLPADTDIVFQRPPKIRVNEELGNFQFGGSTIVMAIPQDWDLTLIGQILARNTLVRSNPHETEIQVGQVLFFKP